MSIFFVKQFVKQIQWQGLDWFFMQRSGTKAKFLNFKDQSKSSESKIELMPMVYFMCVLIKHS